MAKLAVLEISTGSFATGFAVKLQVGEEGESYTIALHGQLPPAPDVLVNYETWKLSYRSRGKGFRWKSVVRLVKRQFNLRPRDQRHFRQLKAISSSTRQRSNLKVLASELERAVNNWLDAGGKFQKIRDQLLKTFSTQESVRLIIQTDQLELWQLPWELWHLVQEHSNVGVALSKREYALVQSVQRARSTVRILVLLGDSTDIEIERDLELLQQYLPSETELYAPKQVERSQISDDLWTQSWDILFFAGHSSSRAGEGKLYLTADTYVTILDLKYALSHAIVHGLKLAIFNSCDGLELARDLADLQLPATIVMREPIPDEAAQKFLGYFLQAFAQDKQLLYGAVGYARQRLQGLEDKYPCVSWLPLICQNPVSPVLEWRSFLPAASLPDWPLPVAPLPPIPIRRPQRLKLRSVLAISLGVTYLVMGVRFLGKLEPLELLAYDHLLRLRPPERLDDRILLVGADEKDMRQYGQPNLSDGIVAEAVKKLSQHNPRVIGIDIYRDKPYREGRKQLISSFQKPNFIGVCATKDEENQQGYAPPPELSAKQIKEQIGFSDLFRDDADDVVRRQMFWGAAESTSVCPDSHYAFSFLLVKNYLAMEGYQADFSVEGLKFHHSKLGTTLFPAIDNRTGGYQKLEPKSNQILIDFQAPDATSRIAEIVSLGELLSNQVPANLIKDKIVLIGVTAAQRDLHLTPYGKRRGLLVHAQAVSMLLRRVKNNHPLIWVLPQWGEWQWGDTVFVLVWSGAGGFLVWVIKSRWLAGLAGIATIWSLYEVCFFLLKAGGWMPLIPAAMGLLGTIVLVSYLSNSVLPSLHK